MEFRIQIQIMEQSKNQVARFIMKTYQILQNQNLSSVIVWSSNQKQFQIKDAQEFENTTLPTYFRHKNINSFVRQLNMYGFHKSRTDSAKIIFSHQFFIKGQAHLLTKIQRKSKAQSQVDENKVQNVQRLTIKTKNVNRANIMKPSKSLRSSQNNVNQRGHKNNCSANKQIKIDSYCSIQEMSCDELEKKDQEQFQKCYPSPPRSLIERSQIFDQNVQIYMNMYASKQLIGWNSVELLECSNDTTSIVGEIEQQRFQLQATINQKLNIGTKNFFNDLYF